MDFAKRLCAPWFGLIVFAFLPGSAPSAAEFESLYASVESFNRVAASRFAVVDADHDGLPDLLFSGKADSEDVLLVVGKQPNGQFGIKQRSLLPTGTDVVRVLASTARSTSRVVTIGRGGIVHELAGWPLATTRTFPTQADVAAAAIGDVDGDGTEDLVVISPAKLNTYSLSSGALLRSLALPNGDPSDVALAQLDADPALEIIVAGTAPGWVVDGATHAIDWSYIDGFGIRLATGRLGADNALRWVGARDWYQFTVFRAAPWSPLWAETALSDIDAIATARLAGSGPDVILVGDGQWGNVRVIDSVTRQQRLAIPNPGHGINAVASADFDGDGRVEIAFSPAGAIYDPALVIADGVTGATLWSFESAMAAQTQTALGDVDGDGRLELVSLDYTPSQTGGVFISDFLTGTEEWRKVESPFNPGPLDFSISSLELVPRTAEPGMDIVLAGTNNRGAAFAVLDGVTKAVSIHPGQFVTASTIDSRVKDIDWFDRDNDGVRDIVTVTYPLTTASPGTYMQVFSGVDGTPLWISPLLAPSFTGINKVLVLDRDGAHPQFLAVLHEKLMAFDAHTGLASWTLSVSNDGAALMHNGLGEEELATFRSTGLVSFHAAANQSFQRSFVLPSPLNAIAEVPGSDGLMIAKSGGKLLLVDSGTGTIRAQSEYLGAFAFPFVAPSMYPASNSVWYVAAGSKAALYRKRIVMTEGIFADAFDASP